MKMFFKTAIFVMAMMISASMAFAQENPGATGTPASIYLTIKADASDIDANQVRATVTWYNGNTPVKGPVTTDPEPKNPSGYTVLPDFMCMGFATHVKYFVEAINLFGTVVETSCGTYSVSPLYHNVLTITSNMWGNCFGSQPAFPPPPDGSE